MSLKLLVKKEKKERKVVRFNNNYAQITELKIDGFEELDKIRPLMDQQNSSFASA